MKPALTSKKPRYPTSWQDLPSGLLLQQVVAERLREPSRHWFGYHLLQVGQLSASIALPECPIKHKVSVHNGLGKAPGITAKTRQLPIMERCIDACVLAFELDFAQDPHQILREVNRVMMPDGHLALIGFNPLSLAGLAKYIPLRADSLLHDARCFSMMRIKDWMHLLGFEIVEERCLLHTELLFDRQVNPDNKFQRWASHYCRWFGSVYILIGKKREIPLSLQKPKWSPKPAFIAKQANI
ncbi:class I SAM-dependent methyltransferase [Bowmanella pacifica]|uniref:SAM-dependent methyltransferase n=1 Tax=Bowmanella pacifica TaxID=502051 RepID=A0A917Z4E9_9ALTE|nr:methyltransferase domain-containing protein [Bowmanella pacifica]GGO72736.1 SAM-dependent methyltransferase [Bowmanella pacifica]